MQILIPVFAILGAAAADARLTLLPYAYLADPLPVYHQSQDTRVGVHAYSYAGGPSAKEEVRGHDGVTRGSYSYVDAHGILQSVFYVADEGGFRVAATNLPTDGVTGGILLTENAHLPQETARTVDEGAEEARDKGQPTQSRRKRSPEATADQDHRRPSENSSSQEDQTDRAAADASSNVSHELPASEKKADASRAVRNGAESVVAPLYSVLFPRFIGTATSHQNRIDVHNNVRLKAARPVETIGILSEPAYETVIVPNQIPLATSHQSRVQLHGDLRVEVPEKQAQQRTETIEVQPQAPSTVVTVKLQPLSIVPDYNENRIQLHKSLGLEGPNPKNTVKIDAAQLAIVEGPIAAVSAIPLVANKEALPLVTAVSSQSRTQIHRNAKLEVAVPIASEPTLYVATPYAQPIATWPILTPIARSSQYRSQIHSNEKIELTK